VVTPRYSPSKEIPPQIEACGSRIVCSGARIDGFCAPVCAAAHTIAIAASGAVNRKRLARMAVEPLLRPRRRLRAAHLRSGGVQSRFSPHSVVTLAAYEAYESAGIGPTDLQVAEIHDAYSSAIPLALEKLGLAPHYEALERFIQGAYEPGGPGPVVNPGGGLLSRGHPPGATGLAQVFEIVMQLREQAGARQISGVQAGLVQNQGGTVLDLETNAVAILILTRS